MESLAGRTAHAAGWRLAAAAIMAASQLAVGAVLARLLAPSDFGLMAMTVVVAGLIQPFTDLGIGAAIVQRRVLNDRHLRVAFTVSMLLGTAIATGVAGLAPWVASLVGDVRVAPLLRLLAVGFAVRGIAIVSIALLRRRLDFRRQFFIDAASTLAGGAVSVGLALSGYGVWSLAWGSVLQVLLSSVALLASVRHPVRPLLARPELGDLWSFSLGSAASGIVNYIARNGDNLIVGRWLGAISLGFYDRAYALMNVPFTYASGAVSSVLFPALAQVQDEPRRLRSGYLAMSRVTAIVAAPMMATMAVAAPHLVVALFGSRWADVTMPLQILCVAGYFRAQYHVGGIVVQSVGRIYTELALQVGYAILVIGGSLAAWRFGIEGVAIAVSAAIVCMFIATVGVTLRIVGLSWREYFVEQGAALATAAACCAVALATRFLLEQLGERSEIIAITIVLTACAPWMVGFAHMIRRPGLEQLQARFPAWT